MSASFRITTAANSNHCYQQLQLAMLLICAFPMKGYNPTVPFSPTKCHCRLHCRAARKDANAQVTTMCNMSGQYYCKCWI